MKKLLGGGVLLAAVIAVLLYFNFTWEGPENLIELAQWKLDGSPSWIEWQLEQAF